MPRKTSPSRAKKPSVSRGAKTKGENRFARPRGMRDLQNDLFYNYQGFFERAAETAIYYGFRPIETPMIERTEVFTQSVGEHTDIVEKEMYVLKSRGGDTFVLRPEGTAPVMRAYLEHGMHTLSQPVMLYYHGPFFRHDRPQQGRWRQFWQFGFEMLGTSHNVADAITIALPYQILKESGFKNLCVLINSIGCRECRGTYVKALIAYYRSNISQLNAADRERLKKNPLRVLDSKEPKTREINKEAPGAVSYLCDACKKHFFGVLEYLDALAIPYHMDHTLVRGLDYYTRTVFEIIPDESERETAPDEDEGNKKVKKAKEGGKDEKKKEGDEEEEKETLQPPPLSLASGGRYDDLAKRFGAKRDVEGVGSAIGVDRVIASPQFTPHSPRIIKKPHAYLIQLGAEARLKSLEIIEKLRKARMPLAHSLSKNKLSSQLGVAEKLDIPFVIIIGQKESADNTVIVRDMRSRSQETVPLETLTDYLKGKMKK